MLFEIFKITLIFELGFFSKRYVRYLSTYFYGVGVEDDAVAIAGMAVVVLTILSKTTLNLLIHSCSIKNSMHKQLADLHLHVPLGFKNP